MKDNFIHFQNDFVAKWKEYRDLQTELQKYAGKEIGSNLNEVNELLHKIQDNFADMYPAMEFVIHNYKLCVAAVNDYNAFIEDIKKEGAGPSPIIEA